MRTAACSAIRACMSRTARSCRGRSVPTRASRSRRSPIASPTRSWPSTRGGPSRRPREHSRGRADDGAPGRRQLARVGQGCRVGLPAERRAERPQTAQAVLVARPAAADRVAQRQDRAPQAVRRRSDERRAPPLDGGARPVRSAHRSHGPQSGFVRARRRHGRGRHVAVRDDPAARPPLRADRLHGDRERRDLPGRRRGDVRAELLRRYDGYRRPIYAVPGNHDWYDGLSGFMFHLCGVETVPPAPKPGLLSRAGLRELLWHRAPRLRGAELAGLRARRDARPAAGQPAPYWLLDTGPLQLVGIDTGITGGIDRDQAAWLRRVSAASPKPKFLVTGKPLYVDGRHRAGTIEGEPGRSIDDVVRDPAHNYVAAVGGDIHNYQRYPVDVGGGRTIQYLVSGGGGAFMHATHTIPKLALDGVDEHEFRCYPLRGDSLSFYSRLYERKWPLVRDVEIDPVQAAAYMAERLGVTATKPDARDVVVADRTRRAAEQIFPLPGQNRRGLLQSLFSEYFDWNDPPLFKHVLHVEASDAELRIRCLAATGCAGREAGVLEDHLVAAPDADGNWRWRVIEP